MDADMTNTIRSYQKQERLLEKEKQQLNAKRITMERNEQRFKQDIRVYGDIAACMVMFSKKHKWTDEDTQIVKKRLQYISQERTNDYNNICKRSREVEESIQLLRTKREELELKKKQEQEYLQSKKNNDRRQNRHLTLTKSGKIEWIPKKRRSGKKKK